LIFKISFVMNVSSYQKLVRLPHRFLHTFPVLPSKATPRLATHRSIRDRTLCGGSPWMSSYTNSLQQKDFRSIRCTGCHTASLQNAYCLNPTPQILVRFFLEWVRLQCLSSAYPLCIRGLRSIELSCGRGSG
jgi:hypothetical protein